jgi:hypothetical protein
MLKTKKEIEDWLERHYIEDYYIHDNLTVDVKGNVNLLHLGLTELPVQFGVIDGTFICSHNKLTSLKGCPYEVKESFACCNNQLSNLNHCPEKVGCNFLCEHNPIIYLRNFNCSIGGDFYHAYTSGVSTAIGGFEVYYAEVDADNNMQVCLSAKELSSIFEKIDLPKRLFRELPNSAKIQKPKIKI